MKIYGIYTAGNGAQRDKALRAHIAEHLSGEAHQIIMVGDFLLATVRALEDTAAGTVAAVGGCLDDMTMPSEHEGFGCVEWRESWLSYLTEHRIAFIALPGAAVAATEVSASSIIRGYTRAAGVLAAAIRQLQTAQRRGAKAAHGGYICGRPPYGYLIKAGAFVIDPVQSKAVRFIFAEMRAGTPLYDLLEELKEKHAHGGVIAGKPQYWDRVKIRRIMSHARMYCLGQYTGGRGQPIHIPALAFLPADWVRTTPKPAARVAS
jgi:hypothetical protein